MGNLVFYCGPPDTQAARTHLDTYLSNLERNGHAIWASWQPEAISPGVEWHQTIVNWFESATLIVLIASIDLCDDSFWSIIWPSMGENSCKKLVINLRPGNISKQVMALPKVPSKPIAKFSLKDDAWAAVYEKINEIVAQIEREEMSYMSQDNEQEQRLLDRLRDKAKQIKQKKEKKKQNFAEVALEAKIAEAINYGLYALNHASELENEVKAKIFTLLPSELSQELRDEVGDADVIKHFENKYITGLADLKSMLGPVGLGVAEYFENQGFQVYAFFQTSSKGYRTREAFLYAQDPNLGS